MSKRSAKKLSKFLWNGQELDLKFIETLDVIKGVQCDVYEFVGDATKDLGVIKISPGAKTPLQKVLKGEKTIEGYISGKGWLTITKEGGQREKYDVEDSQTNNLEVEVKIGQLMQWQADKNSPLVAYEICLPPYKDGRYENIKE